MNKLHVFLKNIKKFELLKGKRPFMSNNNIRGDKMQKDDEEYFELLNDIKNTLIITRNKIIENANKELILMYNNIGLKLINNNKWGTSFIDNLAKEIKKDFPTLKGMSARNLRYMQKFAKENYSKEFLQEVLAKLSWNHNQILLDKIKNKKARKWYAKKALENGWSTTILTHQIKLRLYERQALLENKTNNFHRTLPNCMFDKAKELLKDPYIFDFIDATKNTNEIELEKRLTSNITKLLLELGYGFTFIGRQFHIEINNKDYYIDLLFYNLKLRCYVVIELKTTKLKPEYVGQLNFYLSIVDKSIKTKEDNPTFGILLCREKDRIIAEIALNNINKPIGISEYKLLQDIPKYIKKSLQI